MTDVSGAAAIDADLLEGIIKETATVIFEYFLLLQHRTFSFFSFSGSYS
jgi:hypothetical protein